MHFLVTGAAGFIGSHLVESLLNAGHAVTALDDLSTGKRENLDPWVHRIDFVEGSVLDPATCARAVQGADYVFHEAALASVPRSVSCPEATHAANATGTLNLLIAARDAGVKRVIYAASSAAYGNTVELPKHEGMASVPLSPYAVAKLAGENYMRAFHASYGLETISLRYFNVFGPRQDPESQYAAAIPKLVTSALENRAPTIFGDGEQTRDFTFIDNVVHANMLACDAPASACGGVYNVGCGERVSLNDLWRCIKQQTGTAVDPVYEPMRAGDVRDSLASLDAIRAALDYTPVVDWAEGLRRTIAFFASNGPATATARSAERRSPAVHPSGSAASQAEIRAA
ncbi:MAG TPA: SDR family oxidoreductase [Gemmatimonadaceae bacterium]